MSCEIKIEEDSYDFFDIIDDFIKDGKIISNEDVSREELKNCFSFSQVYTKGLYSETGKDICEQFLKLYTSISKLRGRMINYENYKREYNFFNYWINFKLRDSLLNGSVCVEYFSEGMEQHCFDTLTIDYTSMFMFNIVEEDFQKMKLLYNLYINYSKLDNILSMTSNEQPESILEPSNNCYNYYNQARNIGYDKNNNFCQKLENFKSKYKALYKTLETKGEKFSKNFKRLPEDVSIKIISTATIGTAVGLIPLFGVLYRFTPLGQLFKPNKIRLTNEYSNNDEMRNILLMDQESKPMSSQNERYNIKYHSL